MSNTVNLHNIIINKVQNQNVYNYLKDNGLIKEDEIYINEETNAVLYTPMNLTEEQKAQVRLNIGAAESLTQDDALDLAIELGLIDPATDNEGNMYVDNNNVIYSL